MDTDYVVEMRGISKFFPGIIANNQIDFQLRKGEIHALLGENGAGKSTLMSILFGSLRPDGGEIYIKGKKEQITSPNKAHDLGIGMVHQHFQLIDNFTVMENIMLGKEMTKGPFLDAQQARDRVIEISKFYGLNVDPGAKIEDITVGMQQRVEILKVLYRDADIIILDEPTAVLTPQEIEELMQILQNFAAEGKSVILITHKLKEIMQVADRVTILRQGQLIDTLEVADASEDRLAALMVGREVSFVVDKTPAQPEDMVLEVKDLWVKNARGLDAVKGLSLNLRAGEILGLAGVDGNGQAELLDAIAGLIKIDSGQILLKGQDVSHSTVRERREKGLSYIPADRQKFGQVANFTLADNYILKNYYEEPFCRHGFLQRDPIHQQAERLCGEFDVRSGRGIYSQAGQLSGGNQQKAIIAREFSLKPDLLLASQPTRGLDVGAIEYIHKRLVSLRDQGKAILLLSFELDEIMGLSDRIAVMYDGQITGFVDPREVSEEDLGLLMAGIKQKGAI
ncbi:MAG: ABC transporter ATP-binding protein [Eubacteriales bacterium]|nr:ABC transporter ATP-binding protein [Eubacteriales bacterium]